MIPLIEVINICKNEEYENKLSNDQTELVLRVTVRFNISNREELDKAIKVAKGKNKELSIDEIDDLLKEIGEMIEKVRRNKNNGNKGGRENNDSGDERE